MHDVERYAVEEDEINLLDLLLVLMKHKLFIIGIVFFAGAAAVVISLLMQNIYRSEGTIMARTEEKADVNPLSALGGLGGMVAEEFGFGGGGSLEKLEVVLNSRHLTRRVIKRHELMPIIFADIWDPENKKWLEEEPPTIQDGWEAMEEALSVNVDTTKGSITVGFEHEAPETAKNIMDYYLTALSEVLREEVLQDAKENMRFFKKQLEQTSDTLLQDKLYSLLAKEIEKETFARAQKYYGFLVLDPPIVPDPDKEVKPRRALICILSVIVAFFLAVFLAFFREYLHRLKTDDPEGYQKFKQSMKFRKQQNK